MGLLAAITETGVSEKPIPTPALPLKGREFEGAAA